MILLDGFTYLDLGPDGGIYDETLHPKVCIHTTEGSTLASAEDAFEDYPPHLGYDCGYRTKHQYVDLVKHSLAFKKAESDDEFVIQVEVVGFARDTHNWPDEWYRNFAEDVVFPLVQLMGVPLVSPTFYGEDCGFILASPNSPIRFTDDVLRNFRGFFGHQHAPSPDAHWDPGNFQINKVFNYVANLLKKRTAEMAYSHNLPPYLPEDETFNEEVVPITPPGGKTGVSSVWINLVNTNRPLEIAVAHWQCGDRDNPRTEDFLPPETIIPPRGCTGGIQAPNDAFSLIIDYRSEFGAALSIEPIN